jgi:hypothetical protein
MKNLGLSNRPVVITAVSIGRVASDARLTLVYDVSDCLADVDNLSPGIRDKALKVASEEGAGEDHTIKGPRPLASVKASYVDGSDIVEIKEATVRGMVLRIAPKAKTAHLVVNVTGSVGKKEWAELRESCYASTVVKVSKRKKKLVVAIEDPRQVTIEEVEAAANGGPVVQ